MADETVGKTTSLHEITFSQGWSGLSSYIIPDNPNIESMFLSVQDQLIILYNQTGVYIPDQQVNTLVNWNPQSGYIVKFDQETTLEFSGQNIQQGVLSLTSGWNLIPVLSSCPVNIETLFANSAVEVVKEVAGWKLYWPEFDINTINELKPGSAYYVMMNSPAEITFPNCGTPPWQCGDVLVDTRDGKSYATVIIGDQCWMAENLDIGTLIYSDINQNQTNNGIIEKYCYNNIEANCDNYGGLYQWNEMMGYANQPGAQGICPFGWNLPTDDDFSILANYLGGSSIAGGKMKSTRTEPDPHPRWRTPNTSATNESNWSGLPGGIYHSDWNFFAQTFYGLWWSSTEISDSDARFRQLDYLTAPVYDDFQSKAFGLSVRCFSNITAPPSTYYLNLEVSPEGAGTVTGAGQYEAGQQVNIRAEGNTGWEFVNWTDEVGTVSEFPEFTYIMPANNVTLNANFAVQQVNFTCGDPLVDNRDGRSYTTVQIGNQCWMAENLNIGTQIDGTTNQTNNNIIEKYCYDNIEANCSNYGGLYRWDEVMAYSATPGFKGICPSGWHLPTDNEWYILLYMLGDPAGGKMKSTRTAPDPHPRWDFPNMYATNSSGWSGLPGGWFATNGTFNSMGDYGYFYSSTEFSTTNAGTLFLKSNLADAVRSNTNKEVGLSVRCLYDIAAPPLPTYNLNFEVSPEGAGTVTGAGQYEAGEPVNITAEANPGWEFVYWSDEVGVVSEFSEFTYIMPANNVTLNANFAVQQVNFTCGDPLTDIRDGHSYTTVQIGDQCWMAENLAYLPSVSPSSQGNNTDPHYYVYDYQGTDVNDAKATDNYINYGALYNWTASLNACPEGWHLPSDAEWTILTTYLGGESVAGGEMKSTRTVPDPQPRWDSPNTGATNSSGFTGLPGGNRVSNGNFINIGGYGYFWGSTEYSQSNAYTRALPNNSAFIYRINYFKDYGLSVRCLRD